MRYGRRFHIFSCLPIIYLTVEQYCGSYLPLSSLFCSLDSAVRVGFRWYMRFAGLWLGLVGMVCCSLDFCGSRMPTAAGGNAVLCQHICLRGIWWKAAYSPPSVPHAACACAAAAFFAWYTASISTFIAPVAVITRQHFTAFATCLAKNALTLVLKDRWATRLRSLVSRASFFSHA